MKGDVDSAPHMFLTTPLPKFVDLSVKEYKAIATRISTWSLMPYDRLYKNANTKLRASLTVIVNRAPSRGTFCQRIEFFVFSGVPILGLNM